MAAELALSTGKDPDEQFDRSAAYAEPLSRQGTVVASKLGNDGHDPDRLTRRRRRAPFDLCHLTTRGTGSTGQDQKRPLRSVMSADAARHKANISASTRRSCAHVRLWPFRAARRAPGGCFSGRREPDFSDAIMKGVAAHEDCHAARMPPLKSIRAAPFSAGATQGQGR